MQGILRSAVINDIPEIRALWKDSFFDSNEYLDLFFEKRFNPLYTALYCLGDEIAGMVHLLPCEVKGVGKAFYWYAVCVAPKHRGKHVFTKMSKEVLKAVQGKAYVNVCKPISGLEAAYRKIGFSYSYYAQDVMITGNTKKEGPNALIKEAVADDFLKIDYPKGSLVWKEKDVEYAISENIFCGGKALKIFADHSELIALAIKADDGWYLDSTDITFDLAEKYKNFICNYLNTDCFYIRKACSKQNNSFVSGLCDHPVINEASNLFFTLW